MTTMSERPGSKRGTRFQGDTSLDLLAIEPGQRVRLSGGATAEVVDNPRDGAWLLLRYLEVPDEPELVGEEELVFWAEVLGVEDGEAE
jgi:hypothetical protein